MLAAIEHECRRDGAPDARADLVVPEVFVGGGVNGHDHLRVDSHSEILLKFSVYFVSKKRYNFSVQEKWFFLVRERLIVAEIDAMEIWNKICISRWCEEANKFYTDQNISKDAVLQRGGATFDKSLGKDGEKPWYRASYYVGANGYMDMHLLQNRAVFQKHSLTDKIKNRRAVFVDFGCGPMTSGIVLAEKLSETMANYRDWMLYVGIDASKNMCGIAKLINEIQEGHHLFDRFCIIHQNTLEPQKINQIIREHFEPEIAVFCLSFVLADDTFKKGSQEAEALVCNWWKILQQFRECRETLIVYINPDFPSAHNNWHHMARRFMDHPSEGWRYEKTELQPIPVQTLWRNVITQMISGNRRS